jgi:hypothetical protein
VNRLHLPLHSDFSLLERDIRAPKVLVRIGYGERWSFPIRALVDTGSPVTIVSPDVVGKLGWVQPEDEPSIDLQGLGSPERASGWRAAMNMAFVQSPAQEPALGLLLPGTVVFVSPLVGQGAVLVGQHEALERLRFSQRNQPPFWDFELVLPEE